MRNKFKYVDKYIDNSFYLNNKYNYYFLKKRIKKNNNLFINNSINNYSGKLDNSQLKAVLTDELNTLVLAPAGSGKTYTIVSKINYLIKEKNIKENEILCISFTNETVKSLKEKLNNNVHIFTFHKLAIELLSDYKYNFSIASDYLSYIINEIFLSIVNSIDERTLKYFNNTITNFINMFKNYNYSYDYFNKLPTSKMLEVIKRIYLIYQEELYSTNLIDFNDMINLAISMIKEKGLKRYYKYIIIDEFQDISDNRLLLIKTIKESCNSKLFVVGDDFQSIYRFSGSNIKIITSFSKYFGYTKTIYLENTYRNSYELVKVSSKFIMKNKNQMRKTINSTKHIYKPIKIIYYDKNIRLKLKKLLDYINTSVLVIGRNNYDVDYLVDEEIIYKNNYIKYCGKEYRYMTMHKSKGLEEENVIIINLNNKYFPSRIKDEVSELLLPKEKYKYEEERRLFYVALTRTKNNVYLFVDKGNPSVFVSELIKYNKKYIEVLYL